MRQNRLPGLLLALLVALWPDTGAHGWSLSDEAFGNRLAMALDRGSAYADVVGLSASVAYPYGSSVNPAGADFLRDGEFAFTFAPTLTGAYIDLAGGSIYAGALSGTVRFNRAGTLVASYTRIDSSDLTSHQGDAFGLEGHRVSVWYSQHVTPAVVLGGRLDFTQTVLRITSQLDDIPLKTKTESLGIEFAAGLLVSLTEHWLLGLVGGAGWSHASNRSTLDLPLPPFAFGPETFRFHDNTRALSFRGGIGWRPSNSLGVYGDVQYLRVLNVSDSAGDDAADVVRFRAGVEWLPRPFVALRLGGAGDTDRQFSPSVGVGLYPTKLLQIELAYVYNAFPEVRREFGRAHLVTASLALVF